MKILKADGSIDVELVVKTLETTRDGLLSLKAELRAAGAAPMLLDAIGDITREFGWAITEAKQLYD
jgi:hypothetical protein